MILLVPADRAGFRWAQEQVRAHHYLRKPADPRSHPFAYLVVTDRQPVGCLIFGRPESTRCYQGGLTYGSLGDVQTGRAEFERWEVLNLARVWLDPAVQSGGRLYSPELLPGFADRKGLWRSSLASTVIRMALTTVGVDYLTKRPPCFLEQPYAIRAVLSYCDTRLHRGTVYQAAGFKLARRNKAGIETWWTPSVAGLTPGQDAAVRELARTHPRSRRIREAARSLFQ